MPTPISEIYILPDDGQSLTYPEEDEEGEVLKKGDEDKEREREEE